ncbi:MAG: helix-turn-helix transcriptional regulator [Oscillospiraceae bacterium]|nr:helix-turn-helix transcriptional regulator [Oscillospiraceae bacterium]
MGRLRELRKKRGYTQVKMQLLTGIDQSDYSKLESGKRFYTFEQCRRIALALDTSMDYLAGLTQEPAAYPRAGASGEKKKTDR